jgi:hypothetical protein
MRAPPGSTTVPEIVPVVVCVNIGIDADVSAMSRTTANVSTHRVSLRTLFRISSVDPDSDNTGFLITSPPH